MTLATPTPYDAQQFGIQTLDEAMRYAQAISNAGLVPQAFRQRPADILLAQEIARSMDESTWAIMSEMSIIGGKPAFSAKFMRSRIRQAGHTLRESFNKETGIARAVIIRHDDPSHEHIAEWDEEKARKHGLWDKGHWKKNAELMLKNRALSEVMREACYEVMGSVPYTPDEVQDFTPVQATATRHQRTEDEIYQDFLANNTKANAWDYVGQLYNEAQAAGYATLTKELVDWSEKKQQSQKDEADRRNQEAQDNLTAVLGTVTAVETQPTPEAQQAAQPAQDAPQQAQQAPTEQPGLDGYPVLVTGNDAEDQRLFILIENTIKRATDLNELHQINRDHWQTFNGEHAEALVQALQTREKELLSA